MLVEMLFSDNLISRNRARWSSKEIQKMPALIVGHRATLDHAWGSVTNRWGVVTSAIAVKGEPLGTISQEEAEIIAFDDYWYGECDVLIPTGGGNQDAIAAMVKSLLLSENSIGFAYTTMQCPNCECAEGDMRSPKCPNTWDDISYYERVDIKEIYEVSFVEIPDVRRARVLAIDGILAEDYLARIADGKD